MAFAPQLLPDQLSQNIRSLEPQSNDPDTLQGIEESFEWVVMRRNPWVNFLLPTTMCQCRDRMWFAHLPRMRCRCFVTATAAFALSEMQTKGMSCRAADVTLVHIVRQALTATNAIVLALCEDSFSNKSCSMWVSCKANTTMRGCQSGVRKSNSTPE